MTMSDEKQEVSLTDKFCGAYRALFNYGIGRDSIEEWETQILLKFGHVKATDAIRRIADRGSDHSPTIAEVKREIYNAMPKRQDVVRNIPCSCCHADGGYSTFGLVSDRAAYPEIRGAYVCGFSGWCPAPGENGEQRPFGSDFQLPTDLCMIHSNQSLGCSKQAVACLCSNGEAAVNLLVAKGRIKDKAAYEALRAKVNEAIRRRLAWESGRDAGEPIKVDVSAANAVSVEMINKFQ